MPKFSQRSLDLLNQCHPDLQKVFKSVIEVYDIQIQPSTIRTIEEQKKFMAEGKSQTMNSLHLKRLFPELNKDYSCAVDCAPWPTDWNNKQEFYYMAGIITGIADSMFKNGQIEHQIKWGGRFKNFFDGPHFEIVLT